MKKVLMLASVASMIDQFNMDNIRLLQDMDYKVDVVANFDFGSTSTRERVKEFKQELIEESIDVYNVPIPRSIFDIKGVWKSYKFVKELCKKQNYKMIHCHSPIGGVIARLAARKSRKNGTKVIYTAHGFHFFKGAPLKNWIYYPVEWVCSWMTDILITINKGDYNFAKKHMHSKQIEYIPGVGVDTEQIIATSVDKAKKLSELNIDEKNIVVLSVGELSLRKNHETILKAISSLKRTDITYVVCGTGSQKERLEFLAKELGLENNLRLLGFRRDVGEICKCCDIFAFPSTREGLGLAAIEAMAAGVPVLTSNVQGIPDYSINGLTGFLYDPMDVEGFAFGIQKLADDKELRKHMGMHNIEVAKKYDIKNVRNFMQKIYESV